MQKGQKGKVWEYIEITRVQGLQDYSAAIPCSYRIDQIAETSLDCPEALEMLWTQVEAFV